MHTEATSKDYPPGVGKTGHLVPWLPRPATCPHVPVPALMGSKHLRLGMGSCIRNQLCHWTLF